MTDTTVAMSNKMIQRLNNTYIYSALAAGRDYAGIIKDLKSLMRRERGNDTEVEFLKGTIKVAKRQVALNRREAYSEKMNENKFFVQP